MVRSISAAARGSSTWGLVGLLACGPPSGAREASPPVVPAVVGRGPSDAWHYTVEPRVDDARVPRGLVVHLCFEGPMPPRLVVPGAMAAAGLAEALDEHGRGLPRRGRTIELTTPSTDACVRYAIDFAALAQTETPSPLAWYPAPTMVVTRPAAWLWRPQPMPEAPRITVSVRWPEGVDGLEVSTPWSREEPATDDATPRFSVDPTAYQWPGYVAFGEMVTLHLQHAGTTVEAVRPAQPVAMTEGTWRAWLEDALDIAASPWEGQYPRSRLQVLVLPVARHTTILSGEAVRGGGPGVVLELGDRARGPSLLGSWVTVHELLHHALPYIEEAWLAEGLVTYYTEVLRTRMGYRSEEEGWRVLLRGFSMGRADARGLTMAQTSAQLHDLGASQRVYWSGAALALRLDVALRVDSEGERSLDDAVRELQRCCGDASRRWPAAELLAHLDRWYGAPLFSETVTPYLDTERFPDVEPDLQRLGIGGFGGLVVLDEAHPGATMRRLIMAPRRAERR